MGNILLLTKNCQSVFFCLLLKEMWMCFNHIIVCQVLHRRPVLCLNISTPLTFYAFSKLTPKNQTSLKIVPSPPPSMGLINNRSLNLHKTFSAFKCHSDMLPKTSGTFKITRCAGCFVQHAHRSCRHHLFP